MEDPFVYTTEDRRRIAVRRAAQGVLGFRGILCPIIAFSRIRPRWCLFLVDLLNAKAQGERDGVVVGVGFAAQRLAHGGQATAS